VNATSYARTQLERAFGLLNAVAKDLDEAQYNWKPDGTCHAVARPVHTLTSLDFFVDGVLRQSRRSGSRLRPNTRCPPTRWRSGRTA
jgi:hypothetical protein